mgnify:CR=1 FL=1
MKHILITTIAAVVLAGCGPSMSIHEAVETGNIEVVKHHLAAGADVNTKDDSGLTPLHYAGGKEIAEILIAEGADVNAGDQMTPLHYAASEGHKEVAELLISKGANVDAQSFVGMTPLREAANQGHDSIVELLVTKGADVNLKDSDGRTPLDNTLKAFHKTKTVELLRKHGAKTSLELKR